MQEDRVVVDASVAIKWFLDEPGSTEARRLLSGAYSLSVPDLVYAEVGNVLWKRVGRREITVDEGEQVLEALASIPLSVYPASSLAEAGFAIAIRAGCTVYDGLYLALAVEQEGVLVTADRKLQRRVDGTPLGEHVLPLQDVPVRKEPV
jgi:predicted nucleic acid-binding protein